MWQHNGPESLKKSSPRKSNNSISLNFFDQIPFFALSTMAKNHFLNWENVKTDKNAISRKKFI